MTLEKNGIPTPTQLAVIKPSKERLAKGPVVLVECFQKIPCDPCYSACKRGGFLPFEDINDLPQMDYDKCNGCGICIGACPGLAIFVIDETYSEQEALLTIPWEFLPVPDEGSTVRGLNRSGEPVAPVKVAKVRPSAKKNGAMIISLAVPKELADDIRSIRVKD
ncbi:MAG: 4Fe-4S binding protein [Bacillota bacterium]|nr:4Fe-4S binding protein [Bacillota bacterium]